MRIRSTLAVVAGLAIGGAATLALLGTGDVEAATEGNVGSVSYVQGQATKAGKGSAQTKALAKGTTLAQGDSLKTGKDTKLEAKLLDGSMVRLGSDSELKLDDLTFDKGKTVRKVKMKLVVGQVWAAVRSLFGTESEFQVETATAVAGVRGTRFSAAAGAGGETLVKVYEGKVIVSNEPVYKVAGATKATRKEVPGPQEISKEEWTSMVAGAMQLVRVAANGDMGQPEGFELAASPEDKEWESWNAERDKLAGLGGEK